MEEYHNQPASLNLGLLCDAEADCTSVPVERTGRTRPVLGGSV